VHFGYLYPTRYSPLASGWQPQELSPGGMPRSQWGQRGLGVGGFGGGWGGSGEERNHPVDLRRCRSQEVSWGVVRGASGSVSAYRLVGRTGLEPATLCLRATASKGLVSGFRDDWTAYLRFGNLVWRVIPSSSEKAPALVVFLLQPLTTSLLFFGSDVQHVGDVLVLL